MTRIDIRIDDPHTLAKLDAVCALYGATRPAVVKAAIKFYLDNVRMDPVGVPETPPPAPASIVVPVTLTTAPAWTEPAKPARVTPEIGRNGDAWCLDDLAKAFGFDLREALAEIDSDDHFTAGVFTWGYGMAVNACLATCQRTANNNDIEAFEQWFQTNLG